MEKQGPGRPFKFKSAKELQAKIDDYFANEGKDYPTVTGLALHLDTTRRTLIDYEQADDELSHTIKKAKARVEQAMERHLYSNSVTGIIFNLKNNFGWKDKTETDVTSGGEKLNAVAVRFIGDDTKE